MTGLNPTDRELLAAVATGMVFRDRFGTDWRWSTTINGSPKQVAAADLRRLDGLIYLREGQGAEPIWDVTPAALTPNQT